MGATLKILLKIMKTYKITGHTNGWIAQRDSMFNGKEYITIEKGLTLKEAQKKLLEFFNNDYDTYYSNWGLVRMNDNRSWSSSDGTRGYEYDSRYFEIEEENEPSVFRAEDHEGGCIYIGSSKVDAIESILDDENTENYKLYGDEEIIWNGKIDTIRELESISVEALR